MWKKKFCTKFSKIFCDGLISVDWVSKINLTKSREDEIRKCFSCTNAEFHYTDDLPDFTLLIETFQKDALEDDNKDTKENNEDNNCNVFGESKIDKLIVNVSFVSSTQIK